MWWASVPAEKRPTSTEFREYMESIWHPTFGDRSQELNIVGIDVDETALKLRLDQCLLTDEELEAPEQWRTLPHPFPWPEES
jgi:hypothetical protein